jgi:hypothetical protein
MYEIIFSLYDMSHPTSFFILENEELGQFWIGQIKMKLDECGFSLLPALTRNELVHKLETKYVEYAFPCLDVVSINKNGALPFYGVEKWVTDLHYEIKRNPEKFRKVKKLLTAGWYEDDFTGNSTVNVLHARNKTDMKELYRRLIKDWEAKGMRCLNTHTCKTKAEKYQDKKKDPDFLKAISRKKVLRQMEKTKKLPKPETLEKYDIRDEEIKECMEEVALCQPCKKEFYKKGKHTYCPCDIRVDRCKNLECKVLGTQMGVRVGGSICEHNTYRSTCRNCDGGEVCEHSKIRSRCKKCGGGYICEHNNYRSQCKWCGGVSICEHNINRIGCRKCGGSQVCKHNRTRSACKECEGGAICEHNRERGSCKICNPRGYVAKLRRARRLVYIKNHKTTHTLVDLCMTTREWLKYLHKTFENRYGRPKTEEDEVHIDEIIPCSAWDLPNDNKYCWHYLNSQWLLAEDNISKSDSYEEEDKLAMIERIQSSTYSSSSESV